MKIQYCSDLHLEFDENRYFMKRNPLTPVGDILLLAGDIVPFASLHKHSDFFNYISDNFKITYWVPGNHEYYKYDLAKKNGSICEKIRENIFLVNNHVARHENVNLIFSTLWSLIGPANDWLIQRSISDFHAIKFNKKRLGILQFNELHRASIKLLTSALQARSSGETIVVTHHVPTLMNYPAKYKGDSLNEAFAVELFDFIEIHQPGYWIYGHHHSNTSEFDIGKTKMLTNQLGYVSYNEHELFKKDAVIFV